MRNEPARLKKTASGILVPDIGQGLLVPKGFVRRKNDPRLDDFLWALEQPARPTHICTGCSGYGWLPGRMTIDRKTGTSSYLKYRCSVCKGQRLL